MDRTAHFIRLLHQASPSELLEYSQQRLLGERGPGVDYDTNNSPRNCIILTKTNMPSAPIIYNGCTKKRANQ